MHANDISNDREAIRELLEQARTIAIVGISPKPERPSNGVARYLREAGYTIIPVNPGHEEILGEKCYPSLHEIPQKVDIVDVFRRSEDVPPVVDAAIEIGAGCVWLQLGVSAPAATAKAAAAGLKTVADRCTEIEHKALLG